MRLEIRSLSLGARGTFQLLDLGTATTAPPLVWLHGFPDHPPTALPLLEALASTRRVVAPWLRGYAPSPLTGPFDLETLAADLVALVDHLGAPIDLHSAPPPAGAARSGEARPIDLHSAPPPAGAARSGEAGPIDLVGHDWGGAITYAACAIAPHRIRRAVTLAIPHPLTFLRSLRDPAQLARSWYMALFQLPGSARIGRRLVDHLWRAWSPGFELDRARRAALHACLDQSGAAPFAYYRAIARPPAEAIARTRRIAALGPLLQLHGARDGCVLAPTDSSADARHFAARRELAVIPGVGHFLHLEAPRVVAARIEGWLASPENASG